MNFFYKQARPYFLAEIGVNHNGSIVKAKKLIKSAKECGANGVKFQTFKAKNLAEKNTPKVKYQIDRTSKKESHYEMLKKLELSFNDHITLKNYCSKLNIDFTSTPYDVESAKFLKKLKIPFFKTSSADLVDIDLHNFISNSGIPVVISVGMATYSEIRKTLRIYNEHRKNIILLHCVSNYPCSDTSLNLKVIDTLKKKYKLPIGLSDHSIGNEAAIASVGLGCSFFEKHFTLNKNDKGPDHKASSDAKDFKSLVKSVNRAYKMIGNGNKKVQKEEMEMLAISRKSIRYKSNLIVGIKIRKKNLIFKRPGDGMSPQKTHLVIGKKLNKSVKIGQKAKLSDYIK